MAAVLLQVANQIKRNSTESGEACEYNKHREDDKITGVTFRITDSIRVIRFDNNPMNGLNFIA